MREGRTRLTRRGRWIVALVVLGLLLAAPAGAAYAYLRSVGYIGESEPGESVDIIIPAGADAEDVGRILEEAGVIKSATGFRIAAYFDDASRSIEAGSYTLPTGLTAKDALEELSAGATVAFVQVTFPEGSWLTDFARILGDKTHIDSGDFLKLARNKGSSELLPDGIETMEGLLFPSTYQIIEADTAETVLERLAAQFESELAETDFSRIEDMGYSMYEGIIVASMIEAEAAVPEDRARIARVIYNRIEAGMRLEIDATVLYALGEHKAELTRSDLEIDSPYNTRRYEGLPPTPIGASGHDSLTAAANPEEGPWIFYVLADCEGHHAFSESYEEFLENKAAYNSLDCS